MATISYQCDTCKRSIDLVEQPQGFTTVGKCVITNGCTGRLYKTGRNPNNVRESSPTYVNGLDNFVQRRAFNKFEQTIAIDKWKVTHNMGVLPTTFVYLEDETGRLHLADKNTYIVTALDKNTVTITFATKVKGVVHCVAKSTVQAIPNTIIPDDAQYQVTANSILTLAIPKFLTEVIQNESGPPTAVSVNLCEPNNTIQVEVEVSKPNEDSFVCFEDVDNVIESRSPWNGWDNVLVGKRKNYCVRTVNLLKMKVFGNANLKASDIPDGTRIKFLRIDYGNGRKVPIKSGGLIMLLAGQPYTYADKIKDRIVDVGELIGEDEDYFVYRGGELFLREEQIERSYPEISKFTFVPTPSPSPTPSYGSSPTPTITPTHTVTATNTPTPTPTGSITPTITPTISVTGTSAVTPTPTMTFSPTPSVTPEVTMTPTVSVTVTPTPSG